MKCPRCESTQLRKNGRPSGKQRYLCKACGRQFFEPVSLPQHENAENQATQLVSNEHCEPTLAQRTSPMLNVQAATLTQSAPGIAILLLDAENLKLDINAEKFLATLGTYPLQVKIAFANWRNHAIGKLDAELYERGYQLLHVPGGKNSADAQMMTMGASISRHYPDAKEVFVCSCDWLLTHLCNELQRQGMIVYRVRRQDNTLSCENRNTGENRHYSLKSETEVPDFKEIINRINHLINAEYELISERLERLAIVAELFQERQDIAFNAITYNSAINTHSQQLSYPPEQEQENSILEAAVVSKTFATAPAKSAIKSIRSRDEFEQALVEIIDTMKTNHPDDEVSVPKLSAALQKVYGETANSMIKRLKLGTNFTNFLQSCATFTTRKNGTVYEVALMQKSFPEIKSPNDLEQWLVNIVNTLAAKSSQKHIPLENLGSEFHKQYHQPVSAIIKQLDLDDNFVKFVQSCSAIKVEKIGKGYQVAIR